MVVWLQQKWYSVQMHMGDRDRSQMPALAKLQKIIFSQMPHVVGWQKMIQGGRKEKKKDLLSTARTNHLLYVAPHP